MIFSVGYDRSICSYDDIKEGDIIRGYVKSGTKVGVFVRYLFVFC